MVALSGSQVALAGVEDDVVAFVEADFVAGVIEKKRLEGVLGLAGVVDDGGGEKLREDEMTVGGPAEGVDEVAEGLRAASVFLAFEESAALAVGFLEPDIVVLEVVGSCFEFAIDGIDDAAVGGVGEGGDFVVDGLERFVKILGAGGKGTAAGEKTEQRAELAEPSGSGCESRGRSWFRARAGVFGTAGFLRGREFHKFDTSVVGIVEVELPFTAAADFGFLGAGPTIFAKLVLPQRGLSGTPRAMWFITAERLMSRVGRNVQHVFDPVGAVGNLHVTQSVSSSVLPPCQ